jgi:hypothetical protein
MRRRVLVEHSDPRAGTALARSLHDAGYAVATCPGPTLQEPCPVLRGEECPLASRADVIVSELREHPEGRTIAAWLRVQHPRTPQLRGVEPSSVVGEVVAALGG